MAEIGNWTRPETVAYPTIWRRFEGRKPFPNGKIPKFRIQDMTEDMLEDAIQLMVEHYIPEEPLSRSINIKSDPLSVEEFREIWRKFFGYKMALIGILENRDELGCEELPMIIGCNMTGVLLKDQPAVKFEPKSEKTRLLFDFLAYQHDKVDIFRHYQTSECLYALGLSVHSMFRGQGIGLEFMRARLELGRSVGLKATVTVFSNITSQTVAKQAGFEDLFEIIYLEKGGNAMENVIRAGGAITNMSAFVDLLTRYIDNLQIEGDFATGKIDTDEKYAEFRTALNNYGFCFTTRSSRKETYSTIGKNEKCKSETGKEGEEEANVKKEKKLPGRGSLMFKSSSDVSVPFFGSPFIVERTIYYTCSQGIKYYGSKKYPDDMFREGDPLSRKRRRPKLTQKIGCQARMTVKKIRVFTSEEYVVARDNWREKKAVIDLLRNDILENNKIESITRYCIVISLDISHNHEAKVKVLKRPKQSRFDPARKVLKLHEQLQEALEMLNSELITKCTNIATLTLCFNSLKNIINQLRDSVQREDGVPLDLITAALDKLTQKQLRSAALLEKKNLAAKRKQMKTEKHIKAEPSETVAASAGNENGDNNQVIELSNYIEGTQVIWDPVNVSWVQDGQIVVQDNSAAQRAVKDPQPILVQRRADDSQNQNAVANQNIGVITQGGQNYTILQHGSNVHIPNIGVSVPLTMAKVVHPTTILTSNVKKAAKRNDVGVTAIAIPAGVEWNQQNWGQITQVVSGDGQFANCPTQTIWNITQ